MSKWRPSDKGCLYTIADIHGGSSLLDKILDRILPLRTRDVQDKIVFLGDYVDRHVNSHKVIQKLCELKKEYGDQVICLYGNHELMMLEALRETPSDSYAVAMDMWLKNGGWQTAIGYQQRTGKDILELFNGYTPDWAAIRNAVPDEHIDFLKNDLLDFYEQDNFVFVHGGCNPLESPSIYPVEAITWDRSLFKFVKKMIQNNKELPWEKMIVTGHNNRGGEPIITSKYLMLDCSSPRQLLVVELNSMEAFMSHHDKRLVKFPMKDTVIKEPAFRRVK